MLKHYYFYDCPRTGGTTFKIWCRNNGIKRVYYGDGNGWHHVPFKPITEIQKLVPAKNELFTFTLLRDPIEHTISLYAKIKHHKHGYRDVLKTLTFEQWITGKYQNDYKTSPEPWGFSMVRFYDPDTHNLDVAINNIETINFVGFTERLNEDLNLMLKQAESKIRFNGPRLNISLRNFNVSNKIKNIIKEIRKDDYILVNHFRSKRKLKMYI